MCHFWVPGGFGNGALTRCWHRCERIPKEPHFATQKDADLDSGSGLYSRNMQDSKESCRLSCLRLSRPIIGLSPLFIRGSFMPSHPQFGGRFLDIGSQHQPASKEVHMISQMWPDQCSMRQQPPQGHVTSPHFISPLLTSPRFVSSRIASACLFIHVRPDQCRTVQTFPFDEVDAQDPQQATVFEIETFNCRSIFARWQPGSLQP